MNKIAVSAAAITTLFASHALAADMAVKGPLPAPTPTFSWTGWYVGVNAGASFGRAKTDFNEGPVTVTGFIFATPVPAIGTFDTADPSGFMGGGQIGYNWQWSPIIVLGLEADFQGADERDSAHLNNPFNFGGIATTLVGGGAGPVSTAIGTTVTDYSTRIDWFGTVRGRVGYVWGNGEVMSYLTGGLATARSR